LPSFVGRTFEHMRAILLHIVTPILECVCSAPVQESLEDCLMHLGKRAYRVWLLCNQGLGGQVESKETETRVLTETRKSSNAHAQGHLTRYQVWSDRAECHRALITVRHRGMGTGISEASKRVPIFSFSTQGGKQVSSHFRQRNWVQAREAQIRFPAG